MLIVFITVPTPFEGESLAEKIVSAGLAACVQILPQMTSVYEWKGKVERQQEHLLLIKTLPEKYDELERFITANHSYSVPEIVAIEADRVSASYLKWISELLG